MNIIGQLLSMSFVFVYIDKKTSNAYIKKHSLQVKLKLWTLVLEVCASSRLDQAIKNALKTSTFGFEISKDKKVKSAYRICFF